MLCQFLPPLNPSLLSPQTSLFPLSPSLKPIVAGGQGSLGSPSQLPLSMNPALHPLSLTPGPQGAKGEEQ